MSQALAAKYVDAIALAVEAPAAEYRSVVQALEELPKEVCGSYQGFDGYEDEQLETYRPDYMFARWLQALCFFAFDMPFSQVFVLTCKAVLRWFFGCPRAVRAIGAAGAPLEKGAVWI